MAHWVTHTHANQSRDRDRDPNVAKVIEKVVRLSLKKIEKIVLGEVMNKLN